MPGSHGHGGLLSGSNRKSEHSVGKLSSSATASPRDFLSPKVKAKVKARTPQKSAATTTGLAAPAVAQNENAALQMALQQIVAGQAEVRTSVKAFLCAAACSVLAQTPARSAYTALRCAHVEIICAVA